MTRRLGILLVSLLAACAEDVQEQAPSGMAAAPAVTVAQVQLRPIAQPITASGLLVAREEAAVSAEVAGYAVDEVLVEEGAVVARGQPLARLNPELLRARIAQAEATVKQAEAAAEQARGEAERVKSFDGKDVMSAEQIAARRFQARTAEASVEVARAQLNELLSQEEKLTIRAPVAGIVLERSVRPGDIATLSQAMFRIARDGLIELDAEVTEGALAAIAAGEAARVTLPSGVTVEGEVRLISPRVDPLTKLGRVRIRLPQHPQLRVGGFGRADFELLAGSVPAVPEKAVHFEASGPQVIEIDEYNRAHPVAVRTGARADGFVAIEAGPAVGARVALGGGVFLLDGDAVTPVEAGDLSSGDQAGVVQ